MPVYTLDHRLFEKCNGVTFEFHHPDLQKLPDNLRLLISFICLFEKIECLPNNSCV